jgi:hypothetical protein
LPITNRQMVLLGLDVEIGHGEVGKVEDGAAEHDERQNAAELEQILALQGNDLAQGQCLQPVGCLKYNTININKLQIMY